MPLGEDHPIIKYWEGQRLKALTMSIGGETSERATAIFCNSLKQAAAYGLEVEVLEEFFSEFVGLVRQRLNKDQSLITRHDQEELVALAMGAALSEWDL